MRLVGNVISVWLAGGLFLLFNIAMPRCFPGMRPHFCAPVLFKNFSRANAHGANLSCSCSLTAFLRCFFLDEDNFFNDLSVIVDTWLPQCATVHRTTALVMVTPALGLAPLAAFDLALH
ncbi:hypothetical protein ACLB1S_20375 [Escherichia coli]